MKKTFTIGRDPSCCDIVVYDVTDVVSRSHATLRVDGRRFFITDHSTNGTYRNGIRLNPYVEYKVSPKDDISFGNAARLDWDCIPHRNFLENSGLYLIIILLLAILAAGLAWFFVNDKKAQESLMETEMITMPKDTVVSAFHHKDTVKSVNTDIPKDRPKAVIGVKKGSKANTNSKQDLKVKGNSFKQKSSDYSDQDDNNDPV